MVHSAEPAAVFITGYICSGKSTLVQRISRERSLKGFLHVNADDIRTCMLGGERNDAALRTVERTNGEGRTPTDYKKDANNIRTEIMKSVQEMKAQCICDSLTIPSAVPLGFKNAGYKVTVIYVEIDAGDTDPECEHFFRNKTKIAQARADVRNKETLRNVTISPSGIESTRKAVMEAAVELAEHNLPVHVVSSRNGHFTYTGPLHHVEGCRFSASVIGQFPVRQGRHWKCA